MRITTTASLFNQLVGKIKSANLNSNVKLEITLSERDYNEVFGDASRAYYDYSEYNSFHSEDDWFSLGGLNATFHLDEDEPDYNGELL